MSLIIVSLLGLLISISAFSTRPIDAKPLNQNQVKFRRLPPKEFSAALGSSITIECEAGSSPPPTIHWLKDGKRIQQSELDENQVDDQQLIQVDEINRIALSSTRSRLYIDCAGYQDDAVYTCVAENSFSRVLAHTKLNLIRPLSAAGSENDLISGALEEVAALELAAGANAKQLAGELEAADKSLTAIPQCLGQRNVQSSEPVRIHMYTHNIVEIMKNSVILYCRSNIKRAQAAAYELSQDSSARDLSSQAPKLIGNIEAVVNKSKRPTLTWTLPDDKLVSADQKDKYEILDTGDLLIKDLRWADMGSYICTVSDEQSSDSVSAFVYPAAVKANSKRSTVNQRLASFR